METTDGRNVYAHALYSGRTRLVKKMLELEDEEFIEETLMRPDSNGRPLVFHAAMTGNAGVFEWVLDQLEDAEAHFDFETTDKNGETIYDAIGSVRSGNNPIINVLRERDSR